MSRKKLEDFLVKLQGELRRSSSVFRKEEADRNELNFFFNASSLAGELRKEFKERKILDIFEKGPVQKKINDGAYSILAACRAQAKNFKKTRGVLIKGNQHSIKVNIAQEVNPKKNKNYDNFTKLKKLYKEELDRFALDLNEFMKEEYNQKLTKTEIKGRFDKDERMFKRTLEVSDKEIQYGSDLIEGGHIEGEGILETDVRNAIDRAMNKTYTDKASEEVLKSNLDALGIDLHFVRDDKSDHHTFTAQSRVENQTLGFMAAEDKQKLKKQLKAAIERLQDSTPIKGLKGSDSIEQVKTKQAEYAAMSEYEKQPNLKTTKAVKPRLKKRSAKASQKKAKSGAARNNTLPKAAIPKATQRRKRKKTQPKRGAASSPLHLIGMINKELPNTVRKNMGPPALENQTGRFAESVRVTDITTTKKGFPSIGYTYARNPYQVFEDGSGKPPWSNGDRDPRVLIDKSIREIAIQFAIGRFYTRRQ